MFARITTLTLVSLAAAGALTRAPSPAPIVAAAARAIDPGKLTLATERVIIFKDGYGLFVKAAAGIADAEGKVHTEQVPGAAVLGTFWAIPEGRPLKSTIADWYETVRPKTDEGSCLSTLELLRANEGRQVTFGLGDKELSGKLVDVLEAPALRTKIQPGAEGTYETELAPRGGELVAIDVPDRGRLVMPVASVKTLLGKDLSTHCLRPGEVATRSKRLTFDFGREAAGKPVTLKVFYFTPGVRWIPTYRVTTGSSSKADLELQGEILNEEEDFESAAVDLVVGVPSFKFKGTVSPMSLEQTLRSALSQAMPSLMNSNFAMSNAMFNNRAGERFDTDEAPPRQQASGMAIAADLGAETRQDMFVYPVRSLGLKKGARAMVPLWRSRVPQRHVYAVDLGNFTRTASDGAPLRLSENKVWHQLELTDDTDVPFTTGAAMLMEGGVPLGQDLLGYTSPGGKTMIPITTALNMRAVQSEHEVGRTADALIVNGSRYSLLQKRGTIVVSSHQKERTTVRVSFATSGKVGRVSHGGTVVVDDLDRVNNQSRVTWELTLGAGETVTLTYELSVFR
jgi:hypothetical protein